MVDAITKVDKVREIVRCGRDPVYFIKNYVFIQHPVRGRIKFDTYPFQDDVVNALQNHRLNIVLKSRQLGLSTIGAAYALWDAMFHRDRNILVIATKLETAQNFVKKVKTALDNLPPFLQSLAKHDNQRTVVNFLANGSRIIAVPRSEDAGRSEAISLLIIDECVTGDTMIDVQDPSGNEFRISISNFYDLLKAEQERNTLYIHLEDDDDT